MSPSALVLVFSMFSTFERSALNSSQAFPYLVFLLIVFSCFPPILFPLLWSCSGSLVYSEMHSSLIRDSQKGTETRFSVTNRGEKTVGEVYCQVLHA